MKLVHLGAIATTAIIVIGVTMAAGPAYLHTLQHSKSPPVMLSFSVADDRNASKWCNDLASMLEKHEVKATVFVTGEIANKHPECVASFLQKRFDVGSQTYSYANLTSMDDYLKALEEIKNGKLAVDNAGNIDSRLFKAPYDSTDQNIYSLLSRTNITADFSYKTQYNTYENGQFVKFSLVTCDCTDLSTETVAHLQQVGYPVMVEIDNTVPVTYIENFIVTLKSDSNVQFVNASELTGQVLTIQRESA
jgi:peptidoglycan/xylan/chitin deacetylase (PgdA/CDA1 family)